MMKTRLVLVALILLLALPPFSKTYKNTHPDT